MSVQVVLNAYVRKKERLRRLGFNSRAAYALAGCFELDHEHITMDQVRALMLQGPKLRKCGPVTVRHIWSVLEAAGGAS